MQNKLHVYLHLDPAFERVLVQAFNALPRQEEMIMSQFLDQFRATLEKVSQGNAGDPETKAAVAQLQQQMADNNATDQDLETAVNELVTKLANSTPVPSSAA